MSSRFIFSFIFGISTIISVSGNRSYAQELYQTKKGLLSITSKHNANFPTLHSNTLHINLDMRTAEFDFKLPIKTLHSGVDSVDYKLSVMENAELSVQGMMRMDGINTQPHTPIHFVFNAILEKNNLTIQLEGEGHLEHIPGSDQPACRLQLNFEIDDFELIDGFRDSFNFQIVQSILYQRNMN